jgi:alanine dehydrogenase
MTLILSNDDVAKLLTVEECMAALEPAYVELAGGRGVNRTRSDSIVAVRGRPDTVYGLKTMDGVVPSMGVGAVRINSDIISWPKVGNAQRRAKEPAANGRWVGLVMLFSSENGEPLAIMPDGVMQRIRVAAANGIGIKYMARADADDIAIIGSGWQAGTQLMAACVARKVRRIRCWSPSAENRANFAANMTPQLGIAVEPMADAESAVKGADVVLCATSSIDPVYLASWLEPGVHLSSIKLAEIESAALAHCKHIALHVRQEKPMHFVEPGADAADSETSEKGWAYKTGIDFQTLPVVADLISGKAKGRDTPEDITAFLNNLGMGYQFAVAGAVVYRKAKEQGLGHELPTDWFTEDVHP